MTVSIENGELVIRLPINTPLQPSATGKSLVLCTTHGNKETSLQVQDQNVYIGVTAYIKNKK